VDGQWARWWFGDRAFTEIEVVREKEKTMKYILPVLLVLAASTVSAEDGTEVQLWPKIEPFETGYLEVSDGHEIYYELCGNPDGKPVFFLHGGPGGSCSPYMRRFCDPDKFLMVLHDQRGAGRSKPYAEIRGNNTQNLVGDIERLREHLGIHAKIILFGGSWGSTLGLAYAEAHPQNVEGLVLRGVFTATREEIDHFYHGGVRTYFPEVYDRFVQSLPDPDRRPLPEYLFELIESDDESVRTKYAYEWARYEIRIASLDNPDEQVEQTLKNFNPLAFSRIENYYMANGCFLKEGQLLQESEKIADIPVIMVNGRYDVVCPPITAYRLHEMLPKSELILAERSGHWMGEPAIQTELLKAMRRFED
jgi:proline iminopeptidase